MYKIDEAPIAWRSGLCDVYLDSRGSDVPGLRRPPALALVSPDTEETVSHGATYEHTNIDPMSALSSWGSGVHRTYSLHRSFMGLFPFMYRGTGRGQHP
jgi:hypothetical protein